MIVTVGTVESNTEGEPGSRTIEFACDASNILLQKKENVPCQQKNAKMISLILQRQARRPVKLNSGRHHRLPLKR